MVGGLLFGLVAGVVVRGLIQEQKCDPGLSGLGCSIGRDVTADVMLGFCATIGLLGGTFVPLAPSTHTLECK